MVTKLPSRTPITVTGTHNPSSVNICVIPALLPKHPTPLSRRACVCTARRDVVDDVIVDLRDVGVGATRVGANAADCVHIVCVSANERRAMGGDVCALGAGAYPRRGRRGEAARSAARASRVPADDAPPTTTPMGPRVRDS